MMRISQFGIAIGILGVVLTFMGLFPGVTGVEPSSGIGIVQIFTILTGFTLLIMGALFYVKFSFYNNSTANLLQQIGVRLALTGLLFASMAGIADVLGFGSHPRTATSDVLFGVLQAIGIIGSFVMACIGVLLYAVAGDPD